MIATIGISLGRMTSGFTLVHAAESRSARSKRLAEGFHQSAYFILPLALPPLSFLGTLIFVRYFEREL